MYSDFTLMAATTPRPTQMQRYRQRFMHKLVLFPGKQRRHVFVRRLRPLREEVPDESMNIVKVIKALGERNEMSNESLVPHIGIVTDVQRGHARRKDVPRAVRCTGGKVFEHMPGQCAMLSIPGVGEAMFSITSSPTNHEFMEFR